jgi:hypothetical protein
MDLKVDIRALWFSILPASQNRMHPTRRCAPWWAGVQSQCGFGLDVGFSSTVAPRG